MATYYVRADGTAANKAAATGPASDASACMNATVFAAEDFSDGGHTIYVSSLGGSITNLILLGANISGPNNSGRNTIIGDSTYHTTASNQSMLTLDGTSTAVEWLDVETYWVEGTYVSSVAASLVVLSGTVGAADETSVNIGGKARNLGGDGYSQTSGGSGHINYVNANPIDCGSGRPLTESNQGFTAHTSNQTATITNTDISGCNEALVFVGGSSAVMRGGSITGTLNIITKTGGSNSSITLDGVDVDVDTSTVRLTASSAGDLITWKDCTTTVTVHSTTNTYVSGTFTITGGAMNVSHVEATIQALSGGEINVLSVDLTVSDCSRLFRADGGATLNHRGGTVSCQLLGTSINHVIDYYSSSSAGRIEGVLWDELGGVRERVTVLSGASVSIYNQTVYNTTPGGRFLNDAAGIDLKNCIFYNITDVKSGAGVTVADYNCYYSSEDLGGENSITSDPQFVSAGANFELQETSPAVGIGVKWWGNNPRPHGVNGEPYPDTQIDIGSYQSTLNAGHPANL